MCTEDVQCALGEFDAKNPKVSTGKRSLIIERVQKQQQNINLSLYTLAVSPSLGGSRQHKRNNKIQ